MKAAGAKSESKSRQDRDGEHSALTGSETGMRTGFCLDATLKGMERFYIEAALRFTRGNVSRAARLLGINRTTLISRMEKESANAG